MKLAFVGLGQMGKHMAVNLLKSGAELTAVNRGRRICGVGSQGGHDDHEHCGHHARPTSSFFACQAAKS